jgi:ADP-heptose:LPS heptosyltransferase
VPGRGTALHARVDDSARAAARQAVTAAGLAADRPYAVLLPGASCPSRRYPADRFREVVGGLVAAGLPVVVSGPPAERDLVERVAAGVPGAVGLAGGLDVPGLAGLLAGADVGAGTRGSAAPPNSWTGRALRSAAGRRRPRATATARTR